MIRRASRDTHRIIACIIAVRTLVDLPVLHLVHSHVSLQMARELGLVIAVFASKFEFQLLMFAGMTANKKKLHRTISERRMGISSVYRWLLQSTFVVKLHTFCLLYAALEDLIRFSILLCYKNGKNRDLFNASTIAISPPTFALFSALGKPIT